MDKATLSAIYPGCDDAKLDAIMGVYKSADPIRDAIKAAGFNADVERMFLMQVGNLCQTVSQTLAHKA